MLLRIFGSSATAHAYAATVEAGITDHVWDLAELLTA